MIPLKLQLKNFLSYGPTLQTIDFGPYPLICLSGKNGHGKSALLDAITWAVWGQARKVSGAIKADAHLLHLSQTQMLVVFDFAFSGNHYRIRREYAQTYGKPYAALDFGIVEQETEKFISLTDKTIRKTQTKIESVIGLDYDAFVNSAFLRQGNANEFSKKSPKERKEILASILSLHDYEALKKLALEKAKESDSHIKQLGAYQEKIDQELQKVKAINNQKQTLLQNLKALQKQEKLLEKQHKQLEHNKKDIITKQQRQQMLIFEYDHIKQEEEQQQEKLRSLFANWRTIQRKQHTLPDIKELEKKKNKCTQQIQTFQQQLKQQLAIKEQYLKEKEQEQKLLHELQEKQQKQIHCQQLALKEYEATSNQYECSIKQIDEEYTTIEQELKPLDQELKSIDQQLKTIEKQSKPIDEKYFEKRKQFYHKWITQANILHKELEQLAQKQCFTSDEQNPSCPLCEQNLSASRKRFLNQKFTKQKQFYAHRYKRLSTTIPQLKELIIAQHAFLEQSKKQLQEQKVLMVQKENLKSNKEKLNKAGKNLKGNKGKIEEAIQQNKQKKEKCQTTLKKLIDDKQLMIAEHSQLKQLTATLKTLSDQLKKNTYDEKHHEEVTKQLQDIEQQQIQYLKLTQETTLQNKRKEEIHQLCQHLKKLKQLKAEVTEKLKLFKQLSKKIKELNEQEKNYTIEFKAIIKQKETLLQEKGRLEQQQEKLTQLEKEYKGHIKEIKALKESMFDYQTIATAMSKDGIQALLIEDAIPEIEQEANQLLGQLTDNQAHIFIESLRDLKKGGTKETLDIKISDAAGIRPYELYSGGEAFRIDFSLRLAISKLLARRAGTSLQTLIIDEGFGSQDEEGLSCIMDAIYKIQDNFYKIIIVSHLSSMKDQFPVHFMVEKGPQGSIVNVQEQG